MVPFRTFQFPIQFRACPLQKWGYLFKPVSSPSHIPTTVGSADGQPHPRLAPPGRPPRVERPCPRNPHTQQPEEDAFWRRRRRKLNTPSGHYVHHLRRAEAKSGSHSLVHSHDCNRFCFAIIHKWRATGKEFSYPTADPRIPRTASFTPDIMSLRYEGTQAEST